MDTDSLIQFTRTRTNLRWICVCVVECSVRGRYISQNSPWLCGFQIQNISRRLSIYYYLFRIIFLLWSSISSNCLSILLVSMLFIIFGESQIDNYRAHTYRHIDIAAVIVVEFFHLVLSNRFNNNALLDFLCTFWCGFSSAKMCSLRNCCVCMWPRTRGMSNHTTVYLYSSANAILV